jgi:hypothetical protein
VPWLAQEQYVIFRGRVLAALRAQAGGD